MTCVNTARARRLASGTALLTIIVAAPVDGVRAADLFDDFTTLRGTVSGGARLGRKDHEDNDHRSRRSAVGMASAGQG
jgi:hypothetical protein